MQTSCLGVGEARAATRVSQECRAWASQSAALRRLCDTGLPLNVHLVLQPVVGHTLYGPLAAAAVRGDAPIILHRGTSLDGVEDEEVASCLTTRLAAGLQYSLRSTLMLLASDASMASGS